MKILVLSDSHGYLNYAIQAIERENPEYVIHLGDHSRDCDQIKNKYPYLPVASVKGNCDLCDPVTPENLNLEYCGVKVFATHGHTYSVKSGLLRLFMAAKEKEVHVAVFGHTHRAFCEKKDDIWLLNPGTCGFYSSGSYGIIDIISHSISCDVRILEEGV